MYQFNSNNTKYVIPLDGLDLLTLNPRYDGAGVRPLWTVPQEEYCQFQLNAWRISEESSDGELDELDTESKICQICNIHVPVIYIREHNNCNKHINMKNLYDLIISRGNSELVCNDKQTISETNYYCDDCSIVVLRNNRQTHEESYTHKKSLRNKDLIEQFLKFYSKDINENISKAPTIGFYNKLVNRRNLSFKIDVDDDDVIIIIGDDEFKIHSNNFHGIVEMDGELMCILCEIKLEGNGLESHIESKKHRKKITRYIGNQHCIRELDDNFVHCLLCNEIVLSNRVVAHKVLSNHISNLNQAQDPKIRRFNSNVENSRENSNFGKLSHESQFDIEESDDEDGNVSQSDYEEGDIANESDELKFDSDDCKSEKEFSELVDKNNKTRDTNQTYCDICSVYIDTHNYKHHIMGTIHKQIEFTKIKADVTCQEKIKHSINRNLGTEADIADNNVPGVSSYKKDLAKTDSNVAIDQVLFRIHYHMEETSYGILRCLVCKIKMYVEDMNDHIKQDHHINEYDNMLRVNKIIKRNEKMHYCQVCNDSVIIHDELNHINSIEHQNIIYNVEIKTDLNQNEVSNNHCKEDENPKPHTNSEMIVQTDENFDTDMEIPVDFIENINYQLLKTNSENTTCKVCSTTIPVNAKDIFRHFQGEDHVSKYSVLLKTNRVTKAQNKFFCHVCKTSITSKNELEHILGNKHKSKFPNHDIDVACKISCQINEGQVSVIVQRADVLDNVVTENTNNVTSASFKKEAQMSHLNTKHEPSADIDNAQAVFLKEYYLVAKTKIPSQVICQVCHIMLTNSIINIESHMIGPDHKQRYENLLKINGVKIQDNGFYCKTCKVELRNKNELIHISGVKHKIKLRDNAITSEVFMCDNDQDISKETRVHTSDTHVETSEVLSSVEDIENKVIEDDEINETDVKVLSNNSTSNDDEEISQPSVSNNNVDQTAIKTEESENDNPSTIVNAETPFSKPFHHVTKTANPAEVLCKICNVLLTNSTVNIESHIMGFNHANKYKILVDSNGLKKEKDRYYCGICDVFISNRNDIEHIMGHKHEAKIPNEGNSKYITCEECDTDVPSYYMKVHLTCPEHYMMKLMKDTTAKLDAMMHKLQALEEENARQNRALRVAYLQSRRQQF